MADVGGGRVYIEVVGDATGLHDDIQAKVTAAVAGVTARVGIDVDEAGLRERVDAAARLAEQGQEVRLRVTAAAEGLREKVTAERDAATVGEQLELGLGLKAGSTEKLRAEVDIAKAIAGAGQHIDVEVDSHGGGLAGAAGGAEAAAGAAAQEAGAAASAASATGGLGGVSLATAAALAILTGGLTAATGAAGGLVGMVAPLGGLLAALPAVIGVAGAGLGTLFAGLHGVFGAVGALDKEQSAAGGGGGGAQAYADAQIAAAERVQQAHEQVAQAVQHQRDVQISAAEAIHAAQQQLGNTEYAVAHQHIADARAVMQAEYNLAAATRQSTNAQRQLNDAREQAARNLEDMADAAADAQLSAQQATLDLQSANQELANTLQNPNATAQQRAQAQLAVAQAQQRLKEATEGQKRATEDNNKAQAAGVDGNQQVIAAVQAVADAQHNLLLATQAVGDAQEKQRRDAVTAAQQMADAQQHLRDTYRTTSEEISNAALSLRDTQRSLADALRAQQRAQQQVGASASAVRTAMEGLSPVAQAFARQIHGIVEGPLKQLQFAAQNALIPGLSRALTIIAGPNGLWPQWTGMVTRTGHAIGGVAVELARAFTTPAMRQFLDQLGRASAVVIRNLGHALSAFADVGRIFASAGLPLIERLTAGIAGAARHLDAFFRVPAHARELREFFDQVYTTTHAWGQILKNLGGVLLGILHAAVPAGNSLNSTFERVTGNWSKFVNSDAGQAKLRKFFSDAVPVVEAMGRAIGSLLKAVLSVAQDQAWARFFDAIANAGPGIGAFARGFGGGLAQEISIVAQMLGLLGQHAAPLAGILGVLAVPLVNVFAALSVAKKIAKGVEDLGLMVEKLGIAFDFLAANPVVAIIAGLVLLGIAVYEAYEHFKPFRDVVDAIGRFFKAVFIDTLHAVGKAIGFVKDHWRLFATVLLPVLGPLGVMVALFLNWRRILDIVKVVFRDVIGYLAGVPGLIFGAFGDLVGDVGHFFENVWNRGYDAAKNILGDVVSFVGDLPGKIWTALGSFAEDFYRFEWHVFTRGYDAVKSVVGSVVTFVGGLPGKVWGALKGWGEDLYGFAARAWQHFHDAVHDKIWAAIHVVEALPGHVWNALSGFGGDLYTFAAHAWQRFRDAVGDKVTALVTWLGGLPGRLLSGIGNVDTMLYDAGLRVMQGLWNGLKKKWDDVKGWLGHLNPASWFNDINVEQGHADTNLLPMGHLVMGGLHKGLQAGWESVASWLSTIDPSKEMTRAVGGGVQVAARLAGQHAAAALPAQQVAVTAEGGGGWHIAADAVKVYNPVPEPASQTLPRVLRRIAIMHSPPPRVTRTYAPA